MKPEKKLAGPSESPNPNGPADVRTIKYTNFSFPSRVVMNKYISQENHHGESISMHIRDAKEINMF